MLGLFTSVLGFGVLSLGVLSLGGSGVGFGSRVTSERQAPGLIVIGSVEIIVNTISRIGLVIVVVSSQRYCPEACLVAV